MLSHWSHLRYIAGVLPPSSLPGYTPPSHLWGMPGSLLLLEYAGLPPTAWAPRPVTAWVAGHIPGG